MFPMGCRRPPGVCVERLCHDRSIAPSREVSPDMLSPCCRHSVAASLLLGLAPSGTCSTGSPSLLFVWSGCSDSSRAGTAQWFCFHRHALSSRTRGCTHGQRRDGDPHRGPGGDHSGRGEPSPLIPSLPPPPRAGWGLQLGLWSQPEPRSTLSEAGHCPRALHGQGRGCRGGWAEPQQ